MLSHQCAESHTPFVSLLSRTLEHGSLENALRNSPGAYKLGSYIICRAPTLTTPLMLHHLHYLPIVILFV